MSDAILPIIYLIASVTFVLGLKLLGSPKTARSGNLIAASGMSLAIIGTIVLYRHNGMPLGNITFIIAALSLGTIVGWLMAMRVQMTSMPQMVSFFNGMGGACAALISILEYKSAGGAHVSIGHTLATISGLVIGAVSCSGSIAWEMSALLDNNC
jgi:NAD(P) transhydrogenase subunit beta